MPRKFHSSKKEKAETKRQSKFSLEDLSQKIEALPFKRRAVIVLGIFLSCLFLGAILAVMLNTSTISFFARFSKLPKSAIFE